MIALSAPYAAAALLLAVAGAPKVGRPQNTVRALASVGLPHSAALVRLLGAVEVAVGVAAVTVGGRLAAVAVAASYLAFAAFVGLAMARSGVVSSCGCLGKADTPPTPLHLVLNVAAAAVAVAAALTATPPLLATLLGQPLGGVPLLALVATCVWFSYLALTALPALAGELSASASRRAG